jgi:hypothetical protein
MGGGRDMSKNGEEADSALVRMSTQSDSWWMLAFAETTAVVVVAAVEVGMVIEVVVVVVVVVVVEVLAVLVVVQVTRMRSLYELVRK